ncbi:PREDICTED: synaptogyrin-3 [Aptenodytes forsteri]|nr:PREDICTED: synaptogyrin-3 [Aptenodytes forsteri]
MRPWGQPQAPDASDSVPIWPMAIAGVSRRATAKGGSSSFVTPVVASGLWVQTLCWQTCKGLAEKSCKAGLALKEPKVMLRIISWIFSIVVFGSIVNECYVNTDSQNPQLLCIFNKNESACSYGIAVGIIAFFGCIFFFVVDLYFQQISSVKDRKRAVLLDLGFSGFLSFLWFVAFCFLANQWQQTTMSKGVSQGADAARAAITFSFFSIIVWVALAVKALQRYRLGTDMSLFATDQFATDPNAAYPGYPTGSGIESTETYQSPPFTETLDTNPKGYQVPAY